MDNYYMTEQEIQELKAIELELLMEFDRVCRENNLTYFLFGGTLLGAVRHGGFIPWDDDIDVVMPRRDMDRPEKIASNAFDKNYFYQSSESEANYPLMVAKLRKNNTLFEECAMTKTKSHKGIFIDIFPLDKVDASDVETVDKRCSLMSILTTVISYKCGYDYGIKRCTKIFADLYAGLLGVKRLKEKRKKLMTEDNEKPEVTTVSVFASNYGWEKQFMDEGVYFPPREIIFEGKNFWAPNKPEEYLKNIYGEKYMEFPPVEERVSRHPIVRVDFGGIK